jgi:hypothetical protein
MMVLPFLVLAAGCAAIAYGNRRLAFGCWSAAFLLLLMLFHLHATDALKIAL